MFQIVFLASKNKVATKQSITENPTSRLLFSLRLCRMYCLALSISLLFVIRSVSSQAFASWYTNLGPQVIYQNASTGDLMYSVETGSGPGTGGFTAWAKLPITTPARAGTSLAGTGFSGGDGSIYVRYLHTKQPDHQRSHASS